ATDSLLLEVTLQAKRLVTFVQQSLIDRAMGRMAHDAAFAHRFMFVNKGTALGGVTLETGLVRSEKSFPTAMDLLGHARGAAFHRVALVGFMAVGAAHLSFQDRVMMRQLKVAGNIQVTLQAGFRRFTRVNDQMRRAATLRMEASRTVAGFTAGVF